MFFLNICYKRAIFENPKTLYKYIGNRGLTNMKNFAKKLSAMTLCTVFASMQIVLAAPGLSDASINHTEGGYVGKVESDNRLDLNFNNNAHVNWDRLNVGKGETLNFNAVDGANGLTIVNTVNSGMTTVYGTIGANAGVSKLIISNPNGMLYDGAKFTTAGDLMLTTQALGVNLLKDGTLDIKGLEQAAVNGITIQNSDFTVGGEFNITAPSVDAIKSVITANNGLKLITADGQNFLVAPDTSNDVKHTAVRLESVNINGDVYVLSGKDIVKVVNGGTIDGNLVVNSDGNVALNFVNNGEKLTVKGDVNVDNDGRISYLRNANVDGNVKMANSGGFLEVANVNVKGDVDLTTTVKTNSAVKHFVHVVGDNTIGGDLKIDSIHNIHIGGYDHGLNHLAKGSLNVGGNIDATAREGSVAVTVDTSANKVALTSGTLNIITDGKTLIKANEYQFKANKYIGGVDSQKEIMDVMENYKPLPTIENKAFVNIEGGKVTKVETAKDGYAFIKSNKDMTVDGINAGKVNLSADQADIVIGKDNHADLILVDGDTKNLTVETPANSRDYTLKYTNIKDTEVITINPETEITYEMANGEQGWNKGTQTADNTYLVVPGGDVPPTPPVDPEDPTPDVPEDNDNVKILNNLQRDQINAAIDANEVYTPVAFAADLDDEIDTGVRKNVDGSVTVVRPFTPSN